MISKQLINRVNFSIAIALLIIIPIAGGFGSKTVFVPRSLSVNAARELAGWQREINLYEPDAHYWSLSFTPEYMRNFDNQELVNYLLAGSRSFNVTGSGVAGRSKTDILADYFGLPSDYESTICFSPRITNFVFDIDLYIGLNGVWEGLYFRMHVPIGHTKWDLKLRENIVDQGIASFPAGYMGPVDIPRSDLASSFMMAMEGLRLIPEDVEEDDPLVFGNLVEPFTFGDMKEPLEFGKIAGRLIDTKLSDVQLAFGWNFLLDDWYHFGINARSAIPTGTKPSAQYFFEPIIGNAHHWEAGIGFTGHVDAWESDIYNLAISFYLDANITHLFSSKQTRSFEFKNHGPGSRYMLLEEFGSPSQDLFVDGGTIPTPNQYQSRLVPAINETTFCVDIKVPAQVDLVFKTSFYRGSMGIDIGYNFWYRSAEKLVCRGELARNLALKGDAQIYGFTATDVPIALSVTQHNATLDSGQGATNFVVGAEYSNANADNPTPAFSGVGQSLEQLNTTDSANLAIPQQQVNTSDPAILLTDDDIDNGSALSPHAMTHKFFWHVDNRWEGYGPMTPFLGIGGEVEFASHAQLKTTGLSQWGFWFKGGLSF
ncbi:MAG TPA: hypothetical protein VFF04_04345 [Candidatus Babeliales bacterium]|nr:hypothetical protein [Candidatus Babeliales bacterium]